jgi:hypothetical protein
VVIKLSTQLSNQLLDQQQIQSINPNPVTRLSSFWLWQAIQSNITKLNKLTFCADVTFPNILMPQTPPHSIERVIILPESPIADETNILPSLGENTSAIQNELALSIRASFWLFTLASTNISQEQISTMAKIFKDHFYTGDEYLTDELEQNLLTSNNEKEMRNKLSNFRSNLINLLNPEQLREFKQAESSFAAQDTGILHELSSTPIQTHITEKLTHESEETSRTQHIRYSIESAPILPLRPTQRMRPSQPEQTDNIPRNSYKDTISCQVRHRFIPIENISSNPIYEEQNNQQAYNAIIFQTPPPTNLGFTKQEAFHQAIIHQQEIASVSGNPKLDIQNQAKLFSWAIKNNIQFGISIASKDKALFLAALTTIENYPSLIYCKSGKDRTAVTASLIQAMIKTYAETGTLIDLAEPIFESTLLEPSQHKKAELTYFRSACCLNDAQIQTITSTINTDPTNTPTHFINLCDTNLLSGDFRYARLSWDLLARTLKKQGPDDNKISLHLHSLQRQTPTQRFLDYLYRKLTWHNNYKRLNNTYNFLVRDFLFSIFQIGALSTVGGVKLSAAAAIFLITSPYYLAFKPLKKSLRKCSSNQALAHEPQEPEEKPAILKNVNTIVKSGHHDFISGWLGGTLGCFSLMNMNDIILLSFLNLKQSVVPKNMQSSFCFRPWGGWRFASANRVHFN